MKMIKILWLVMDRRFSSLFCRFMISEYSACVYLVLFCLIVEFFFRFFFFFVLPIQNHFDVALNMHWHFEQIKKGSINSIHLVNRNPHVSYVLLTISFVHFPNLPFHFLLLMNFFFARFHFCAFSTRSFYVLISVSVFHLFITMNFAFCLILLNVKHWA